jgi:hypothetical protein
MLSSVDSIRNNETSVRIKSVLCLEIIVLGVMEVSALALPLAFCLCILSSVNPKV